MYREYGRIKYVEARACTRGVALGGRHHSERVPHLHRYAKSDTNSICLILSDVLAVDSTLLTACVLHGSCTLHTEKDGALARRFQPVFVEEPSVEETISILRGLKAKYEIHHGNTQACLQKKNTIARSIASVPHVHSSCSV